MLLQFPFLDAVLSETMRLLPPISLGTIRVARSDMSLCGYRVPAGSYVNVRFSAPLFLCSFSPPAHLEVITHEDMMQAASVQALLPRFQSVADDADGC